MKHPLPYLARPSAPRQRPQRGFSLIEVLVSVLLLSLGVLGLIGLQARTMEMSGEAEDRNRAAMLADDAASLMWMQHSVTLSSAALTAWQNSVAAQLPSGAGTVTTVAGKADAVDVTITWRPPARATDDGSTLNTRVILSEDPTP